MSDKYVIQWRSQVNGRAGRGSKPFTRAEATRLAEELNREYPDIEHEAILAPPPREPETQYENQGETEFEAEPLNRRRKSEPIGSR